MEVISASPRWGPCIVGVEREPELWQLCVKFIWSPWGDSLAVPATSCLSVQSQIIVFACLLRGIVSQGKDICFLVALGSFLSLYVIKTHMASEP